MTYFFGGGQGGPGALAQGGSSHSSPTTAFASRAGRDSIGKEFSIQENGRESPTIAAMAAKAGAEPGNAAFDMKSLGKHIEAVSHLVRPLFESACSLLVTIMPDSFQPKCPFTARRNGDKPDSHAYCVVLLDCPSNDPRFSSKGDHAPLGKSHLATGAEPSRIHTLQAGPVRRAPTRR